MSRYDLPFRVRAVPPGRGALVFLADIARHLPHTRVRVLEFALRGREQGLFLGLGLGGKEVGHPPEDFVDVYAEAKRKILAPMPDFACTRTGLR